ncbi:ABC transporter permease [Flexivirga caeni]|uniref:ABC transporter permease n=1 Tax=Flexivirga caeni TaxID=2294115 RepID=A0A3M9M769_9MICO|nr:ABC transporter permease [Flexivirga caeni]RNI21057.1 ABC transporter permease [Flexivirga caeni]
MASTMRKVSLRNLAAHKVRLALTVLAVLLGTSFVAGSLVFTGTMSSAFNGIFDKVAVGVDAQITPRNNGSGGFAGRSQTLGIPDSVISQLQQDRQQLHIAKIEPAYTGAVAIAKKDGSALQSGGAPSVGVAWTPPEQAINPHAERIVSGHAPQGPTQVALNDSAAKKAHLSVGDTTKLVVANGTGKPMQVTIVGISKSVADTTGYVQVSFQKATAERLFSDGSHASSVSISAQPGTSSDQLVAQLKAKFPQYKIETGAQVRKDAKAAINGFLQVFNYILLAFAGIGLVVGTFLIYNTFSMIVAQRVRELALLRSIGASKRQISRSVLLEALVIGLVGGLVGLGVGIGIAAGLKALLSASGSGLPSSSLVIGPTPVIACLVVGVVVTTISAWFPARRASKVSPVEAMREGQTDGQSSILVRTIIGLVFAVFGIVLIAGAAASKGGGGPAGLVGLGGVLLVIAIVLAGPAISRPVIRLVGFLARPFGKIGQLARTNAVRNPRRTAATAFSLTLGLMLVAVIGTMGSSLKGSIEQAVKSDITGDLIVSPQNTAALPTGVGQDVRSVQGVGTVVQMLNMLDATGNGKSVNGAVGVSGDLASVFKYTMIQGSSTIHPEGMLISDKMAKDDGWKVGQTIGLTTKAGTSAQVPITGIYKANTFSSGALVGISAYDKLVPAQLRSTNVVIINVAQGAKVSTVENRVGLAMKDYLTVRVQTKEQFANSNASSINQLLVVLYGMLGLALVIAVLGIINTLALSVVERRREIGMLRAVGMARAQVRRMIYVESILIALFGALLGMVVGVVIGWALVKTFEPVLTGIHPIIPWGTVVFTLIAAAVVGLLAALWPGIRAARTKPLEAIADV